MPNDEEKEKPTEFSWEKYRLHLTVIYADDVRWASLAARFRCQDQNAGFIVLVSRPYFIPAEFYYVAEEIDLTRPKAGWEREGDEDTSWKTTRLRTRIFRFDREPTKKIVPPVSLAIPAQPYAEITWASEAISNIEIRGLENLVPRGSGVADEAKRLGDAVDTILSLSNVALRSWMEAKKAKLGIRGEAVPAQISPEEKWLARACPAARTIGLRGDGLTRAALAQELKVSEGTIANRKRDHPDSWTKIEAAHAEGMRERLTPDRK